MEGGSFEDDLVDPHRFRYAEYKQKARFRATKQGQSIYNEDQDDQRYNNNYTDFHNRRSRSMPNRNTYQEGMEFSFGRFREQERENRYFPDYKERKDRYFQNKNERFFPQSREFTNTQYKQRQQTNRRALTDRGLFPDHRLVRTFPRDTYNTDQFYNDFDQERTQKRMARTTRRNHRKTLGRRMRMRVDENWYHMMMIMNVTIVLEIMMHVNTKLLCRRVILFMKQNHPDPMPGAKEMHTLNPLVARPVEVRVASRALMERVETSEKNNHRIGFKEIERHAAFLRKKGEERADLGGILIKLIRNQITFQLQQN